MKNGKKKNNQLSSLNKNKSNPIIAMNTKPFLTQTDQFKNIKIGQILHGYELPDVLSTHDYELKSLEKPEDIANELNDEVEEFLFHDTKTINFVKFFLKHGNVDRTIKSNIYIENILDLYYSKLENRINFIHDINAAPFLKNNFFINQLPAPDGSINTYHGTVNNLIKNISGNKINLLQRATIQRLNHLKKYQQIIEDNKDFSEMEETETYDYEDYAYLNNKNEVYKSVNIANDKEKNFIFENEELFVSSGRPREKKVTKSKKYNAIISILESHCNSDEKNKILFNRKEIDFIKKLIKEYYTKNHFI